MRQKENLITSSLIFLIGLIIIGTSLMIIGTKNIFLSLLFGFIFLAGGLAVYYLFKQEIDQTEYDLASSIKNIIFFGRADMLKNLEFAGGWLFLTDDEIIFITHRFVYKMFEQDIPLNSVSSVSSGTIPNSLQINTDNGEKYTIVVKDNEDWRNRINNAIAEKLRLVMAN